MKSICKAQINKKNHYAPLPYNTD